MNNSLISVIIPVYNMEDYVEESINSILNQTYKNIEIIIIDDGSTDKSIKILEVYEHIENITLLTQENLGQSSARNRGIKIAKGKYIYFLDSDDFLDKDAFENLILLMEDNNLDIVRFSADPFIENVDKIIDNKQYDMSKYYIQEKIYKRNEVLKISNEKFLASPVLYIMRKDLLIKNNILFFPSIIHEDELFTLEVILNIESMMYDSRAYYKRRYRKNSTMTNNSISHRKKSFESICIIINELNRLKFKNQNKLEKKLINKRIKMLRIMLLNNFDNLDSDYKKNELKKTEDIPLKLYIQVFMKKKVKKFFYLIKLLKN